MFLLLVALLDQGLSGLRKLQSSESHEGIGKERAKQWIDVMEEKRHERIVEKVILHEENMKEET